MNSASSLLLMTFVVSKVILNGWSSTAHSTTRQVTLGLRGICFRGRSVIGDPISSGVVSLKL
jgi:hypothetical protein